jgi:protein disulfide-isomerase A1
MRSSRQVRRPIQYLISKEHDTSVATRLKFREPLSLLYPSVSLPHTTQTFKMRTATLLISFVSALTAADLIEYPTQGAFNNLLDVNGILFVSFTSRTLESVGSFNNDFAKAAAGSSILSLAIDCDTETSLCSEYDINSYPAIRLFERDYRHGQKLETTRYRGPRTPKALLSFLKKRNEIPALSHLKLASDMSFRRVDPFVIVAFLDPEDATHLAAFEDIAQDHHFEFAFGYTTNTTFAAKEKVQTPSIIAYRNDDGDNVILGGPFTYKSVQKFLTTVKTGRMIKDFREKDVETFMQRDKLTVYIFTRVPDEASKVRRELTPIAAKYVKFVTFAVVDLWRYADMPHSFGIEMAGDEAVVVHAPVNDEVFFYEQGKKIVGELVDSMLLTILQSGAKNGDVFGGEAEDVGNEDVGIEKNVGNEEDAGNDKGHDEL